MFCVSFNNNDKAEPKLSLVGGKAKALIETTRKGFQVPEGFVLTVDFFEAWMCDVKKTKAWNDFLGIVSELSQFNDENLKQLESICDEIKKDCMAYEFYDKQKEALLSSLHESFDSDNCIVAVRSSSPEEDLDGKSFAGGYETMLGVSVNTKEGSEQLTNAIRHCFASAFDARIVQYKAQQNLEPDTPRIALVVQRQIASEVAGVVFSLNVQNNCYDEAVINSNFGVGESVVGGNVTPDYYAVDKVTGKILEQKIAAKKMAFWLDEKNGGIVEETYEFKPKTQSSLSEDQILEVTDLATRVEAAYKKPMDLEWAIQNGNLYLLQSRPITTYIPIYPELLTKPGEEKHLYVEANRCQQGLPDACSELGMDLFMELNLSQGIMRGMFFPLHGRHFIHCSYYTKFLSRKLVEAQMTELMDAQMRKAFKSEKLLKKYCAKSLPDELAFRKVKLIKVGAKGAPVVGYGILKPSKAQKHFDKKAKSIRDKLKVVSDDNMSFVEAFNEKMKQFNAFFTINTLQVLPVIADMRLRRLFRKVPNSKELLDRLHSDLPGNPTNQMGHALYKLATFPEVQNTETTEELAKKINSREGISAEFLEAYDSFMDRFGARVPLEIDIAAPRHYEAQEEFLIQLKQVDLSNKTMEMIEKRKKEAYDELFKEATKMKQKKTFTKNANIIERMMGQREVIKYMWVTIIETLRKVALKQGKIWSESGRLDKPEDIFNLTIDQIKYAEEHVHYDTRQAVFINNSKRKVVENVKNFPVVFDSRGKIIRAPLEVVDGSFVGDPISGGLVRGIARVLRTPFEKPVAKGEIIVAPSTNPTWTPVFINAGGCVIETGGPLNHCSIIAREYGLPLVSGISDVCDLIEDGQLIEVDGTNGTVRILNDDEEGERTLEEASIANSKIAASVKEQKTDSFSDDELLFEEENDECSHDDNDDDDTPVNKD